MVTSRPSKPLSLRKLIICMATGFSLIFSCTSLSVGERNDHSTKYKSHRLLLQVYCMIGMVISFSYINKIFILHHSMQYIQNGFKYIDCHALGSLKTTCETLECNVTAQQILKNMDITVDPCDNFYGFACGKFIKEIIIPRGMFSISLFARVDYHLQGQLRQSVIGNSEESNPKTFKLLQSYYNVCLNTENIEKSSINEVKNVLNDLGGWPVLLGESFDEYNFDWKKLIYQMRKIGYIDSMKSILKFDIEIDQKNNSRYIVTLDQASTGIAQEYLSKGVKEKVVQAYYKYMVELANILGADHEEVEKELVESLNFEISLAKISLAIVERRNMSKLHNLKTVSQLQSEYPYVPWFEYLNQLLSPQSHIDLADEVVVKVPSFLESLSQLISITPIRILANYMIWRVVQESADYMNPRVQIVKAKFQASMTGAKTQQPRWAQCISYLSKNLPRAIGALYVRRNFDKKSKTDVENLVNELRGSFEDTLEKIDWMDLKTKNAALEKLRSIKPHVAYPDEFFDNEKLDEAFESLKVEANSFLKSHLRSNLFDFGNKLERFRNPVEKSSWLTGRHGTVAIATALYGFIENSIHIPAGILQSQIFNSVRPKYMNYGAIGFIIGHELTHGFDDQGSQYDKAGNLANWWDNETKDEYSKRAQCIIDQYSNYTVAEVGLNINGKNTQGENIADNGGVKTAYFAYENYEKQNGEEPRLPGLPYSPRQLFWISAANVWCEKVRPEALKNSVITQVHSPMRFRVIGPLSKMPQFARDFNCPLGSPMNPVKKCTVW